MLPAPPEPLGSPPGPSGPPGPPGPKDRLRILFVASEVEPFAKTGGLGDVTGSLPRVLAAQGHDVRVMVPKYRGVERAGVLSPVLPRLAVPVGDRVVEGAVLEGRLGRSVPAYFVVQDHYYDRPAIYGEAEGLYADNCERFTFFCRGALIALRELGWFPHVVHAHDWPTGLVPVYLETLFRDEPDYRDVGTVFTVHNLAYQGTFWHYDLPMTGLGWDLFTPAGIEFYGHLSFLKGGLVFADQLTTVSPTYAREIQTPEYGERMDGILRERSRDLVGIMNGLDTETWNPATDGEIPKRYDAGDADGKAVCAAVLREELGLRVPEGRAPLCAVVSRLAEQKGLDWVIEGASTLLQAGGQLVVLGSGEERYEEAFRALARRHPDAVAVRLGFDERLAHRIYAGADLFLMPSRYEPCGLGQLIALRYGAAPVVRRTGGLADSVREWHPATGQGTGFLFDAPGPGPYVEALGRALAAYQDAAGWRRLVHNAMAENFSWEASAAAYVTCYRRAIKQARRHA